MNRLIISLLLLTAVNFHVFSEEIVFPPELIWWIDEAKTVNSSVDIAGFTLSEQETNRFNASSRSIAGHLMAYPIFMRWNYSGSLIAYYDFNYLALVLQNSEKYEIYSNSKESHLVLANRNKSVFFIDSFESGAGIDSYYWLTDMILITVGSQLNEKGTVDLIIKTYLVNNDNKTVLVKIYTYGNAFTAEDRKNLKLRWVEQRKDHFEGDVK